MPVPLPVSASLFRPLLRSSLVTLAAAALMLGGCSQPKPTGSQPAGGGAETASQDAGGAARKGLGAALSPVLRLLKEARKDLKADDLDAAVTVMAGFPAVWQKAVPAIKPAAGDDWATIESAAKGVSSTFAKGAKPDAATAKQSIEALMKTLKPLKHKDKGSPES